MESLKKLSTKLIIKPKLMYFTVALAFYMFHQFRGQFIYDRYDVEKGKLGLYLSVPQAFSFFSNIWIGSINDKSGRQKSILTALFVIGGICFELFFWTNNSMFFWSFYICYFSFMSATIPLLDKVMMDYVSDIPGMGSKSLGSQRIWLTFGYLVTNFSVEKIISTEDKTELNYDAMRPFNCIVTGFTIFFTLLFVKNLPTRDNVTNYFQSFKALLRNFEYMYFIFIIVLCGISRAFMTTYLGLYYAKVLKFSAQENNLGLPGFLNTLADWAYGPKQSTTTVFGVFFEILVFYKSSWITDNLGFFWPIFLSQLLQLARFVCYYNLSYENSNSFALCCLIELIKGASYSLIHTSALQLANLFCPADLRTTSQLVYSGSFIAIGTVLSGLIFQGFFSADTTDIEEAYGEFRSAFAWNIYLSIAGIALFVYKYGIVENLLFNRQNAKNKIIEFEQRAAKDTEALNKLAEKDEKELNGATNAMQKGISAK